MVIDEQARKVEVQLIADVETASAPPAPRSYGSGR